MNKSFKLRLRPMKKLSMTKNLLRNNIRRKEIKSKLSSLKLNKNLRLNQRLN